MIDPAFNVLSISLVLLGAGWGAKTFPSGRANRNFRADLARPPFGLDSMVLNHHELSRNILNIILNNPETF